MPLREARAATRWRSVAAWTVAALSIVAKYAAAGWHGWHSGVSTASSSSR